MDGGIQLADGAPMATAIHQFLRGQLLDRRQRLGRASVAPSGEQIQRLLHEVDAALARMDEGSFGICENCHDTIECERLIADPLVRVCLDHLSGSERTALERDLELAAEVQKRLLPPCEQSWGQWEIAYHYDPAGVVSGDYCDVVDAGSQGLYFMVGDVSGKGVAASMLMAHLHATFRALISVGLPLRSMLEHVGRIFVESTLPTHYATLICGRAQADGRVEICNAGHPRPLVLRDCQVTTIECSGLPVGLFADGQFFVDELRLDPGNGLLLFSDGVSEAVGSSGEEYGLERLIGVLAMEAARRKPIAAELVAACRDDLKSFRHGADKLDDVTLLMLSRAAA